jgi:flagellar hook-associated protein 3 FlgL
MIFNAGVSAINRQSASLLHLQQQVASGRRILTPADDPVGAARALEVTQSKDILGQYATNQQNANSALGLAETQLTSVNDLFARIKQLTVQAGNATLSSSDRRSIAFELRSNFDELLGIANAADGQGLYLFSGYMGSTKPFGGTVDQLNAASANEITYQGDDGQRTLQVSSTRMMEVSDSGNDVFRRIRNGNGYFVTDYSATNTGTGIIDAGSVTNPSAWNAATAKNLEIRFFVDSTANPQTTYYDLVDTTANQSLLTGAAPAVPVFPGVPAGLRTYQSNQPIELKSQGAEPAFDLGSSVTISGEPATGDKFTLAPSTSQSIFKTLANLIGALESNTSLPAEAAKFHNEIGFALRDFDQANDNILRVRAMVGSRMSELDSLGKVNGDLSLQYQQTLSNLQDLDYAKAISDLTRKQTDLQAAQQSFARISQLSLFNYL